MRNKKKLNDFRYFNKMRKLHWIAIIFSIIVTIGFIMLDVAGFMKDYFYEKIVIYIFLVTVNIIFAITIPIVIPVLLTRFYVDKENITFRRLRKVIFIFHLKDIAEISITPEYNEDRKTVVTIYFVFSKQKDFTPPQRSIRRGYFIQNNGFIIATHHLEHLKPFLDQYNKEILNVEKYKDRLSDDTYSYLMSKGK